MGTKQKQTGGGNRKKGRNLIWCGNYRLRGQREINKAARLVRHLTKRSDDNVAFHTYTNLPLQARDAHPLPDDFERLGGGH